MSSEDIGKSAPLHELRVLESAGTSTLKRAEILDKMAETAKDQKGAMELRSAGFLLVAFRMAEKRAEIDDYYTIVRRLVIVVHSIVGFLDDWSDLLVSELQKFLISILPTDDPKEPKNNMGQNIVMNRLVWLFTGRVCKMAQLSKWNLSNQYWKDHLCVISTRIINMTARAAAMLRDIPDHQASQELFRVGLSVIDDVSDIPGCMEPLWACDQMPIVMAAAMSPVQAMNPSLAHLPTCILWSYFYYWKESKKRPTADHLARCRLFAVQARGMLQGWQSHRDEKHATVRSNAMTNLVNVIKFIYEDEKTASIVRQNELVLPCGTAIISTILADPNEESEMRNMAACLYELICEREAKDMYPRLADHLHSFLSRVSGLSDPMQKRIDDCLKLLEPKLPSNPNQLPLQNIHISAGSPLAPITKAVTMDLG